MQGNGESDLSYSVAGEIIQKHRSRNTSGGTISTQHHCHSMKDKHGKKAMKREQKGKYFLAELWTFSFFHPFLDIPLCAA